MRKKGAKPGPAKKPAPPWAPVPVAVQIRQHQAALKAAKTRRARAAAAKKHPAAKPVAKKQVKRKLAQPGESCVLDACYAIAGCRPDLDSEDGLFIPDALEALAILGLISGFAPADVPETYVSGLILGVDLPGPHAVLTTPGGWWSWGELYDPDQFPDAVIEEAWEVTWPPR